MSQFMREASEFYLQHLNGESTLARDEDIAAELRKCTNRICSLLAKLGIDMSVLAKFLYNHLDETGQAEYDTAYMAGIKRLRLKLTPDEEQIRDQMTN